MSQPEYTEPAPDKPPGQGRAMHVIGAILLVVVLPVVLMDVLVGRFGANAMFMVLVYVSSAPSSAVPTGCCLSPHWSDSQQVSARSPPTAGGGSSCWPSWASSLVRGCGGAGCHHFQCFRLPPRSPLLCPQAGTPLSQERQVIADAQGRTADGTWLTTL